MRFEAVSFVYRPLTCGNVDESPSQMIMCMHLATQLGVMPHDRKETTMRMTTVQLPTLAPGDDDTTREVGEAVDLIASLPPETLAETLSGLSNFYKRFVHHRDDSTYDLCALWAAHTHSMATWRVTPRLFIVAPERECGKTTQTEVLKFASHEGIRAASTTPAGLFSIVTTRTVFLDEVQNLFTSDPQGRLLRAVVNDGNMPDGFVLRKDEPVPCYGALAFSGIENGKMSEDTRSRCIPIQMRPGTPAESFDPYDHIAYRDEVRARFAHASETWTWVKPVPGRFNQIWAALASVAEAAGGDWPDRLARAVEVHQWPSDENDEKGVLSATRDWFTEHPQSDRVASSVLAEFISAYDTLPRVSAKSLRGRMKGYTVKPHKISNWYYFKAELEPVWAEWLPHGE